MMLASLLLLPPDIRARIVASTAKHWWWDRTNNPFRGCARVSEGCLYCWCLLVIAARLRHDADGAYAGSDGHATFVPSALDAFRKDLQPKRYFTPSMSDPFHEAFSDDVVLTFIEALRRAPWHWYFVLTKRSARLAELGPSIDWPDHVCAVVSVESGQRLSRIADLQASGAKRIGVSFEPVVAHVPLATAEGRELVRGLDYAIVGGETAARGKVRPMRLEWAREIVSVCVEEGVPVFFKQWGDVDERGEYVGRKKAGRALDGRTYDELPHGCAEHLVRAKALAEAERIRRRRR